ncbi:MAG: hypothetical protein GXY26_02355 [Clostridiales bacterium]|nr:hypothetical protein [Clostridiales bacterium]
MDREQSGFYRFLRRIVQIFTKKMHTIWEQPFENMPSVFVCNHDRAYGPIAMCAHFDRYEDVRPWINSPVLSIRETPSYVRRDFWWKPGKWYTWILDHTLAYIVALILPPILKGSACIPVYHDTRVISTLKDSISALKSGKHIILFPEHPSGYCQYEEEIVNGFVSIGRLFYRRTKQILYFYPTFIDWSGKTITVSEPVPYDPDMDTAEFTKKVSDKVESHFRRCEGELHTV